MYNKAFEITYKSEGVNKRIDVEIEDYNYPFSQIEGTEDIFTLSYLSENQSKEQSILTTEAEINIFEDERFNIDELATSNETEIKIKYYVDNVLTWQGFVIPDFFQTDIRTKRVVRLIAIDRISTLRSVYFNLRKDTITPLELIVDSLKLTGLELDIRLFPVSDSDIAEGLQTDLLQTERLQDKSFYDALLSVLIAYDYRLVLFENAWNLTPKSSNFMSYMPVPFPDITFDDNLPELPRWIDRLTDIGLVDLSGQREIKPTASEVSVLLEYGGSARQPKNAEFDDWTMTGDEVTFNGWVSYYFDGKGAKVNTKNILDYRLEGASSDKIVAHYDSDSINSSLWWNDLTLNRFETDNGNGYNRNKDVETNSANLIPFTQYNKPTKIKLKVNYTMPQLYGFALLFDVFVKCTDKNTNDIIYYIFYRNGQYARVTSLGTLQKPIYFTNNSDDLAQVGQNRFVAAQFEDFEDIEIPLKDELNSATHDLEMGVRFFGLASYSYATHKYVDVFLNSVVIEFEDENISGDGILFKIKQGSGKFSKVMETEDVLFSDKINRGVNGYFYNYPDDDTSIVVTDFPNRIMKTLRNKAFRQSKAREVLSISGNFAVNPLSIYRCVGGKEYIMIGGKSKRNRASVILEEINNNPSILITEFIYTEFNENN